MTEWTDARLDERDRMVASLRRFYSQRDAYRWLQAPHHALGGRSPNGLILQDAAAEVWAEIDRLATGAYA